MSEVTVRQLAETVNTPAERLLKQMHDAGLPQTALEEVVTDAERHLLLTWLKRSHGESGDRPRRVTLQRREKNQIRAGQGKGTVDVEVRRRRTFVKREETAGTDSDAADAPAAPAVSQSQMEAGRAHDEERSRQQAYEAEERRVAEKAEEAEQQRREQEDQQREERESRDREEQGRVEAAEREAAQRAAVEAGAMAAPLAPSAAEPGRHDRRSRGKPESRSSGGPPRGAPARGRGKGGRRESLAVDDLRRGRRTRRGMATDDIRRTRRGRRGATADVQTQAFERPAEFISREIAIPAAITVGELAQAMSVKAGEVVKKLMGMGVMATINQALDQDTAMLVVEELGHTGRTVADDTVEQELVESLQVDGDRVPRPPVVTVMGHVDHGKTSLLDKIRRTRVAAGEAGGITQHIGAYCVSTDRGSISFLDTPGHAAFSAMRARGAKFTDIVVLVVAADDGVKPQTEEAIQHARAAGTPLVVAVNKCDLEAADPERVRTELGTLDVVSEAWGGDTQFINVSAQTGDGIPELLDAILLQSELQELSAVPEAPAQGVVIESRLERGRGPVVTLLVQNGTLKRSDVVVAGQYVGRVRAMLDDTGVAVDEAGPSVPVELLGLNGTPDAGDEFSVASDDRTAREVAAFRAHRQQEQRQAKQRAAKMDNMFANVGAGAKRVMNVVVKCDVRGSLEAIQQALEELGNDEVEVRVVGAGVGGINETDANLALTAEAVIFGFNVRADNSAKRLIDREGIDLRYYSVIYEIIDDVRQVLSGMLAPELRENIVGIAEVREVFRSPRYGQVAGCMVVEGTVHRNKRIRVLRDDVVIFEGELESLRRFKDDVQEVGNSTECGIAVRGYNDVREGDKIEVFDQHEVARSLE